MHVELLALLIYIVVIWAIVAIRAWFEY